MDNEGKGCILMLLFAVGGLALFYIILQVLLSTGIEIYGNKIPWFLIALILLFILVSKIQD